MKRTILGVFSLVAICVNLSAQTVSAKFGNGLKFTSKDNSSFIKVNFRFQNLFINEWDLRQSTAEGLGNHNAAFLVRRSRLKFAGGVLNKKVTFKAELGLSNRDMGGGNNSHFNNTAKFILDAYVTWNAYKNFSIQFGQGKLPGNRERVISSANLQFVDRSRLNSRFNLDRDVGIWLKNHHTIGNQFLVREIFSFTQGEGRNVTDGFHGGFDYTFRLEMLPFGEFESKGDYIGAAIKSEAKPKLALGFTYDINDNAARERGQNGDFILSFGDDFPKGKALHAFFADLMFKYQGLSIMGEFVYKRTLDGNPLVYTESVVNPIGEYYTGLGTNLQLGYMLKKNWEIAARWTSINPHEFIGNIETQTTLGISKYIVGHNLKIQTDITYRGIQDNDDQLFWRTQVEVQF